MHGFFIAQQGTGSVASSIGQLLPIALIIFIFYFVMYRPVRQKQRAVELMISKLSKGDRVITSGGIYGTVVQDKDHTLMLKVSDNVKLEISKSAVVALQSPTSGSAKE